MPTPNAKRHSNGGLPPDIIQEILLMLPVKSLCRFKCVCKQWCALIRSPRFVNQHFRHENNPELLLIRYYYYSPDKKGETYVLYVDEMYSRYEEPDHLQLPQSAEALLGPLNGVFCVLNPSLNLALLNPSMRQFRPLPVLHSNLESHFEFHGHTLGFGLDPLTGDYKVVLIQYFWNVETNDPHYPPLVSLYNSGSDSWRHFEGVDLFDSVEAVRRSLCNTYLNGFYYWLVELDDGDVAVLAFDMSIDEFQLIQIPDCIEYEEHLLDLDLHGNSIALLLHDYPYKIDKCIDIWVMEKEGCWTRTYSISPLYNDISWPLGFLKNNELLTETEPSLLILYNVSTKKSRTFGDRGNRFFSFLFWVFSYKESLVSIKGEGDNCKLWDTSSELIQDFFK